MTGSDLPADARLVRELLSWLEERGRVPMLVAARPLVVGEMPGVPAEAEQVVLNVSSRAVRHLEFHSEGMTFSTGFGPVFTTLTIPWGAVLQVGSATDGEFVGAVLRAEPEGVTAPPASRPDESAARPVADSPRRRFRIVTDDEG